MPRVKIDYIVSFSSEDSENPASNLLQWVISKKKWLCPKGEPSCSVVFQLIKSTKISAVNIGAYHAALVEVLVGRSETPNDQFQVLVPSSIFLSPIDSRKAENVEKVRSFSSEHFAEAARNQKWDRVRVVCSQPYNKHCKFGLSFIEINEPESSNNSGASVTPIPQTASAVPTRLLAMDSCSSDEDEFRPGQLFATHTHLRSITDSESQNIHTDAQIRQATSQALKNTSDTSAKLIRTPIAKTSKKLSDKDNVGDRQRDSLIYEEDDDKPHAKIDRVVQRHKEESGRDESKGQVSRKDDLNKQDKPKLDSNIISKDKESKEKISTKTTRQSENAASSSKHKNGEKESRKRPHSEGRSKDKDGSCLKPGPVSDNPHTLMRDVVFVLSGYENPKRGSLRTAALAMGAKCERDWSQRCTHLICAFPNTPKLKQVRASPNGANAPVVKGDWIEECAASRRLMPWQWYATEPRTYIAPTHFQHDRDEDRKVQSECDTDDEIEKVLKKQKKQRLERPPSPRTDTPPDKEVGDISRESDVQFVRDERVQGNVTIGDTDSDATDEDTDPDEPIKIDESKALPDFFEGYTFVIDDSVMETKIDADLLGRYVRAYGGILIDPSQRDEDSDVNYVLCGRDAAAGVAGDVSGVAVRADWVWKCHEDKQLSPIEQYRLI